MDRRRYESPRHCGVRVISCFYLRQPQATAVRTQCIYRICSRGFAGWIGTGLSKRIRAGSRRIETNYRKAGGSEIALRCASGARFPPKLKRLNPRQPTADKQPMPIGAAQPSISVVTSSLTSSATTNKPKMAANQAMPPCRYTAVLLLLVAGLSGSLDVEAAEKPRNRKLMLLNPRSNNRQAPLHSRPPQQTAARR